MLSALATVDPQFPLQLWDKFLPQIKDSLDILHTSRRDAKKSALDDTNGTNFNFNRTPISILGTKGMAYDDPNVQASWAPHGTEVIYVGRLSLHYRFLIFFTQPPNAIAWQAHTNCTPSTIKPNHLPTRHKNLGHEGDDQHAGSRHI